MAVLFIAYCCVSSEVRFGCFTGVRGVPRPGAGCLFPLKRPKGKGVRALPFGNPHPGIGDYQIAPLPRSGKGRWRPLAAIGEKGNTSKNRLFLFENTLRGGVFRHFAQFCRKNLSYQLKCEKFSCLHLQFRKRGAILKSQMQTGAKPL